MSERPDVEEGGGNFSPDDMSELPEGEKPDGQLGESMGEGQGDGMAPEGFDEGQRNRENNFQQGDFPGNVTNTNASGFFLGRWLAIGLYAVALILAVLAGIFILKGKKWAVILGILLSFVLAGTGLFSLFNTMNGLRTFISLVKMLLGIGVVVLLLLPGARKGYLKKKDIFDEEDYALYYGDDEAENDSGDETESETA